MYSCTGMLAGIFLLLGMTPFEFAEDLTKSFASREAPISKRIGQLNHPKEAKGIQKTVREAKEMMTLTGRGGKFAALCALSLFLAAMGAVIWRAIAALAAAVLFCIILMAYAVIKVFFANLKRGGILLIQIAVGSLYMFSVPRGYLDGFYQWCKQVVGLCLTAFLQATILIAGLSLFHEHALLGLGLMLSAGEIPRIAGAFGLDTSAKANLSSAVYTAQTAINITKTVAKAAAA